MKDYSATEPIFSETLQIVEPSDPAHADKINAPIIQLMQNVMIVAHLFDEDVIQEAFNNVFGESTQPEIDPEAMTDEEITEATAYAWDGSTSNDPTAMTSVEVEDSTEREWDGRTSDDPTAITSEEVDKATR